MQRAEEAYCTRNVHLRLNIKMFLAVLSLRERIECVWLFFYLPRYHYNANEQYFERGPLGLCKSNFSYQN